MDIYMESEYTKLKSPARLYIKQCPHCGLKYLGRTEREDIEKYKGSGKRWKNHLKKHNIKPIHVWNSDWYHDAKIKDDALYLSKKYDIVFDKEWANLKEEDGMINGGGGFEPGSEAAINRGRTLSKTRNSPEWKATVGKRAAELLSSIRTDPIWKETVGKTAFESMRETINDETWKKTIGKEKIEKQKKTVNSTEWKETVGKEKSEKTKKTVNSTEWKETVGKKKGRKISQTKNSVEWKETVGKSRAEKMSKLYSDEEWRSTTGAKAFKKISDKRNDPEWIRKNTVTCEHCDKSMQVSNYKRWHGDNCKFKR